MRVGMTHYSYHPVDGGVETRLVDLGTELVRQGHEVRAPVAPSDGQPADHVQIGGDR